MSALDRFEGALLGLACGDAVGTTAEFQARDSFTPLTDMVGGGPFSLKAGQWTDDTSMALCLAESLIAKGTCDPQDQMARYANWYEWGYWSSTGHCFDIGMATREAIQRYLHSGNALAGSEDARSAGNGSLMRLSPVAMMYAGDELLVQEMAALSSRTTHAAVECLDACRLFAVALSRALQGADKVQVLNCGALSFESQRITDIAQGRWRGKCREQIHSSGYVVHSLEAAFWCFEQSDSLEMAVLEAANLGDDADTTAAITGQIAGAFWGRSGVPVHWLEKLHQQAEISLLAQSIYALHQTLV